VVVRAGGSGCGEQGGELQWVQHRALLSLPRHLRPGHGRCRVRRDDPVDHRVLVERGDRAEPTSDSCRRVVAVFEVAHIHLELAPGDPQHLPVEGLAPTQKRLEILGVGGQGRFPVAGQEGGHRQSGHIHIARHQLRRRRGGRHYSSSRHSRKPVSRRRLDHQPAAPNRHDRAGTIRRSAEDSTSDAVEPPLRVTGRGRRGRYED
jgi:hypothetical protein